jgi:serine protease
MQMHGKRSALILLVMATLAACGGGGGGSAPAPNAFSISGNVSVASGVTVDGDSNDPEAALVPNNVFAQAQLLPNPATVAGFVTFAPTGKTGDRFQSAVDPIDGYKVTLSAGQVIQLAISEHQTLNPDAIDLELFLFDDQEALVQQSITNSAFESIPVTAAGTYFIAVQSVAGASNYTLTIGIAPASAGSTSGISLTDEFVPGEVIVRFKDQVLPASGADTLSARANSVRLQAVAGGPRRPMLMRLGNDTQRAQSMQALGVAHKRKSRLLGRVATESEQELRDTALAVQALRARPDVASADLNYIRRPLLVPNDTYYSYQWHYPMINLPQAWDITTGTPASGDVIVAVIDTGVQLNHPDLAGKLIAGYDFISNPAMSLDNNGIDANPDDPGDQFTPAKSSFHGTHVAGTVGAATNNGGGVAGVSWGAKIMPIRVLGKGGGTDFDIIEGVRYAAGLTNGSGTLPAKRADIINLSLGGPGFSQTAQTVITQARNLGVIIIAAAGNDNSSQLFYPASYAGVVSVSAVDMNKVRAPYSNFGTEVDVAAPGGNVGADLNNDGFVDGVLSTKGDDSTGAIQAAFEFENGTSMASPHVAGVAALMKAVHPGLTPANFDSELSSGGIVDELGAPGRDDTYGHGLINALKAVQRAQSLANAPSNAPALVASTTSVSFGITQTSQSVRVENGGTGTLTGVTGASNQAWLTVAPTSTDTNGLGTYTLNVNATGLAPGLYQAKINFSASTPGVQPIQIAVTIEIGGAANSAGTVGVLYVVLQNADTLISNNLPTVTITPSVTGSYDYNFTAVPNGNYYVFAGTDLNNDGFICDAGEACGGHPSLDQLGELVVSGANVTNKNFMVGFPAKLTVAGAGVNRQPGKKIRR